MNCNSVIIEVPCRFKINDEVLHKSHGIGWISACRIGDNGGEMYEIRWAEDTTPNHKFKVDDLFTWEDMINECAKRRAV